MKIQNKAIFLAILSVGVLSTIAPSAFAAEVSVAAGSGVPGCEETNECWFPAEISIGVGETVMWSNDDTAAHTVTAGDLQADAMNVGVKAPGGFESGLFMSGATFEATFDTEGTYPYFCMVHPWMVGTVIVGAMAEEPEGIMEEAMMSGVYLGLDIDPMLPFDNTENDMVTLTFTAKSDELKGTEMTSTIIDHLDYKVMISKDGNEVWTSEVFHDHDGNLELQITPSEGTFTRTEAEEVGSSETKAYMISGPVFMDNGNYQVTAQIVGIEFQPLSTPLTDDFTMEVVPEFGSNYLCSYLVVTVVHKNWS